MGVGRATGDVGRAQAPARSAAQSSRSELGLGIGPGEFIIQSKLTVGATGVQR